MDKRFEDFRNMLIEFSDKVPLSSHWHSVKDQFRKDPRYEGVLDRDRERDFNRYMSDRIHKAKENLRLLFKETQSINYKTKFEGKEWEETKRDLLVNDKRWRAFDSLDEERDKILHDYIKELKKKHDELQAKAASENENLTF